MLPLKQNRTILRAFCSHIDSVACRLEDEELTMRMTRIEIYGLFGLFDHQIR